MGSRLTGAVVRLVMDWWMEELMEKLEDDGMIIYMIRKYVDDVNFVIQDSQPEAAWCRLKCNETKPRRQGGERDKERTESELINETKEAMKVMTAPEDSGSLEDPTSGASTAGD